MASPTKKTKLIRKRKQIASGRKRKNALALKGSTPSKKDFFKEN